MGRSLSEVLVCDYLLRVSAHWKALTQTRHSWPKLSHRNNTQQSLAFTSPCRERKACRTQPGLAKVIRRKIFSFFKRVRAEALLPAATFLRYIRGKKIHFTINDAPKIYTSYFHVPFIVGEFVAMVVGRNNIHQKNIFSLWI